MKKAYQQIVSSFLYGPPIMVPDWVDGGTSPREAFTQGVELAKSQLKKMIEDERGIEPKAGNDVTHESCGCLHCDMGYPMSESGKEHFWCDVTGTREFSAPCANSTNN